MKIRLLSQPKDDVIIPGGLAYRMDIVSGRMDDRGPVEWFVGSWDLNPAVFVRHNRRLSANFRTEADAQKAWKDGFDVSDYELASVTRVIVKQRLADGAAVEIQ